jgi:tRNA (guanine9-N1)-methyltransferase
MSETPTTPPLTTTEEPKGNKRTYLGKEYDITEPRFQGLSKNQIKKILKEELWQESKADRTKEKRAKHKRKRAERQQLVKEGVLEPLPKRPKSKYMTVGNVGVVLDCSFSHLMNEKEISSMRQQICRCYSANVRAEKTSMQMTLTSLDEPLEQIMDEKAPSWRNWRNFEATKESFVDKLSDKKEDLIYLSADSDNVAYELEDNKTYIIGGIVDKNRHKNLCNNKANEHNIKTAQLPIGDYIKMATRKVLTVNQGNVSVIVGCDREGN